MRNILKIIRLINLNDLIIAVINSKSCGKFVQIHKVFVN